MKNEVRQLKIAVILSVFTVIIFCGLFVYSWFFGYSSGKFSSALLVAGGIVILIKNYVLYYKAKKRNDSWCCRGDSTTFSLSLFISLLLYLLLPLLPPTTYKKQLSKVRKEYIDEAALYTKKCDLLEDLNWWIITVGVLDIEQ